MGFGRKASRDDPSGRIDLDTRIIILKLILKKWDLICTNETGCGVVDWIQVAQDSVK
jgi:hypothetical protein